MAENIGSSSAGAGGPQKQQRTLDKWIEPSLPEPVPSYRDRPNLNIPAFGVLTHMAPLGTLPNSKMQKIAKTDTAPRIKLKNGGGASGSSVSTPMEEGTITPPEPMLNPSIQRFDSHKAEDTHHQTPVTPTVQTPARAQSIVVNGADSSMHAPRTFSQPAPYVSMPARQPLSMPRQLSSSMFTPTTSTRPPVRLEQVVLSAIRSARGAGRHHTAFALTDLITNHRDDPNVDRVLRAVATSGGNINSSLLSEFSVMVQQKKRESRRKGLADRRESATFAGSNIRFATPSYNNSPSKKAPAVSDAIPEQLGASRSSPMHSSLSPPKTSPQKDDAHVSKKLKSNDFEHVEEHEPVLNMNGSSVQPSLDEASRSSSPLSDLEELEDDLLLQGGDFVTTEPATEDHATVSEIKSRRARPSSKKKTKPKLNAYLSNPANMAVAPSLSPSSSTFPSNNNTRSHKKSTSNVPQKLDPNDVIEVRRRLARNITLNNGEPISQSNERAPMNSNDGSDSEGAESSIAPSHPVRPRIRLRNGPKPPAANDDSDKSSPTFFPFQHELAPPSSTNSRQSTPNPYGRPIRKAKSGPRVKSSPMKNRAVPLAGISRASGERNSPVANGGFGPTQDDLHDDYCSSCGGGGMIVCCDGEGCRRSYHWLCLDPPRREEDVDPTESIFCSSCTAAMKTATKKASGLLSPLLNKLERNNPVAFRLGKDIRELFEGVKTGPQGEYEDILPVNHRPKNRAGYEEAPDYLRLKDSKGNVIICHRCQRSAATGQSIIDCNFCPLHWHLDCLDPPLANPPSRDRPWKCPCHVDDLLDKMPGMLGPAHKYRKIKGVSALRPSLRIAQNNGHIEIENSESEQEENSMGFYYQNSFGQEYRLPERSIKLDFLTKIKQDKMRGATKAITPVQEQLPPAPPKAPFEMRPIHEQQATLNLAQLAGKEINHADPTTSLINALISQAPAEVVALMAQGDATNLGSRELMETDKVSLLAFRTAALELLKKIDELTMQAKKVDVKEESESTVDNESVPAAEQHPEEVGGTSRETEDGDTNMLL